MKKNSLLFCCFMTFILTDIYGQIKFEKNKFFALLSKAKEENKLIYIDMYADWCGPCKMLERDVLSTADVGQFYNKAFINAKIDIDSEEGTSLAKVYGIRSIPAGLYLDSTGKVVHQFLGYKTMPDFLYEGRLAIKNTEIGLIWDAYEEKYSKNKTDYAVFTTLLKLRNKIGLNNTDYVDAFLKKIPEDSLKEKKYLTLIMGHTSNLDGRAFDYIFQHKNESRFKNKLDYLLQTNLVEAIDTQNEKLLNKIGSTIKLIEENATLADEKIVDYRMQYYLALKKYEKFHEQAKNLIEKYTLPSLSQENEEHLERLCDRISNIGLDYVANIKDVEKLKKVAEWLEKSIQVRANTTNQMACACVWYKMGEVSKAIELQTKVLNAARTKGENIEDVEKVLAKMEKREKF